MAKVRVEKNRNYTLMSNYHLRDKQLSLKAKGLMSFVLSLPEDWNYSVEGLASVCMESKNTINSILHELEDHKYIKRTRIYENGKIADWEYIIYEEPNLYPKNEDIENLDIENCAQINTNIYNNNIINNKRNYNKENIIKRKNIYFSTSNNDNLYFTKDNLYTEDNTSNNTSFNSPNVKYKVLTIANYNNVKYKVLRYTKEKTKENIYNSSNIDDNIKEKKKENPEVQEIFDYYNTLELKKMRNLNEKTIKAIKKALKEYPKEKLFEMMRRFKCIVKDEFYYYSYVWNVEDFFCRKEGYKQFDDDGEKWQNYISKRPIVKTDKYFDALWDMYPNKSAPREAKEIFQNKFVGLKTSDEALTLARSIYAKCRDYVEDTSDQYVMSLGRWLKAYV